MIDYPRTDVLFTHSYFLRFDPKEFRAMMPYPPLGTLYAAAVTRQRGYSAALFDSMLAATEQEIVPVLSTHRPRIVVLYDDDFNYLTKMCLTRMREAAFTLAALARKAGCIVIVHGSDASDHVELYLDRGCHYVILGEGEHSLADLLDAFLRGNGRPEDIPGLAFRRDNALIRTPAREVTKVLDALPFPAWDIVDLDRYRAIWMERHGYFSLNMVTTRGCPYHCNWCAKPLYGQGYASRSPANVVAEMRQLADRYAANHIWFCDDIFGLRPGWIEAFSRELEQERFSLPFKCLARADLLVRPGTVDALRRAGCVTVWLGAESGSQTILDAMEKGVTVGQIAQATHLLRDAGIGVGFFLQYGYPGETAEDIGRTLAMVHDLLPDDIGVSVTYPLPGTPLFQRVREELQQKQNWRVSEDLDLMFQGTFPPEFYRVLHSVTHKKLRMWQGQRIARQLVRRPRTWKRRTLRRLASGAYHALTLPLVERRLTSFRERAGPRTSS